MVFFRKLRASGLLTESKKVVRNFIIHQGVESNEATEVANYLVSSIYDAIPNTINNKVIGVTTIIFLALEYGLDNFEASDMYNDMLLKSFMSIALDNEEFNENEYSILNNMYLKLSEDHVNIGGLAGLYKIAANHDEKKLSFDDWYSKVKNMASSIEGSAVVELDGLNVLDLLDDAPARNAYSDGLSIEEYAQILAENFVMPESTFGSAKK